MTLDTIVFIPEEKPKHRRKQGFFVCENHQTPRIDPATGKPLQYGNGCHKHNNCFTCPFEKCRYDPPRYYENKRVKPSNKPIGGTNG